MIAAETPLSPGVRHSATLLKIIQHLFSAPTREQQVSRALVNCNQPGKMQLFHYRPLPVLSQFFPLLWFLEDNRNGQCILDSVCDNHIAFDDKICFLAAEGYLTQYTDEMTCTFPKLHRATQPLLVFGFPLFPFTLSVLTFEE